MGMHSTSEHGKIPGIGNNPGIGKNPGNGSTLKALFYKAASHACLFTHEAKIFS